MRRLPLLLLLALADCGQPEHPFPSLLPRPIEKQAGGLDAPTVDTPETGGAQDNAVNQAARAALADAEASVAPFDAQLAATRRLIAAAQGQAVGGEPWIAAQEAITRLDGLRGEATNALATLDRLRLDAANQAGVDTAALDAAWTRASGIAAEQQARYAEQAAALPEQ